VTIRQPHSTRLPHPQVRAAIFLSAPSPCHYADREQYGSAVMFIVIAALAFVVFVYLVI
jgi:hypothetical protein